MERPPVVLAPRFEISPSAMSGATQARGDAATATRANEARGDAATATQATEGRSDAGAATRPCEERSQAVAGRRGRSRSVRKGAIAKARGSVSRVLTPAAPEVRSDAIPEAWADLYQPAADKHTQTDAVGAGVCTEEKATQTEAIIEAADL